MSFTALMLGFAAVQTNPRKISFSNETFVIDGPEGAYSVPLAGQTTAVTSTADTWKVKLGSRIYSFGNRSMKVESKGKTVKMDFTAIALTPKLFTSEEIASNRNLIASGTRSDAPDAISGWVSQGQSIFVLLRWNDRAGRGWMEALVKLSTEDTATGYTLVGRFHGLTTAKTAVSNMITRAGEVFAAMTVTEEGTGVATLSPIDSSAGFKAVGARSNDAFFIPDSAYGVTRDPTAAGTTIVSVLETSSFSLRKAAEIRGDIEEFMQPSIVKYRYQGRSKLLNMVSGAELPLPSDAGIGATPAGVLLWVPKSNPRAAALYSSVTFRTLGKWTP